MPRTPRYSKIRLHYRAATDMARFTQRNPNSHERTAAEEADRQMEKLARCARFRELIRGNGVPRSGDDRVIVYYFALLVAVGYAPTLMERRVWRVNLAYLFALSQFFMAWIIAALYMRAANRFDRMAREVIENRHD